MSAQNKVKHLVVDTSAFIKNLPLQDFAENVYTTKSVVDEITDKRQLRNLVVLPYELKIKDVFIENIKFVTEFSKKTGDYPSLSAVDIQVMALCYQLEKEHVGTDHLNSQPQVFKVTNFTKDTPAAFRNIAGFYLPSPKGSAEIRDPGMSEDSLTLAGRKGWKGWGDKGPEDGEKQKKRVPVKKIEFGKPPFGSDTEDIQEVIKAPGVERVKYEEFDEFPHPSKPIGGTDLDEDDIKKLEAELSRMFQERFKARKEKTKKIVRKPKPKNKDPKGGGKKVSSAENSSDSIDGSEDEQEEEIYKCGEDNDHDGGDDDDIWDDVGWITLDNLKEAQLEVRGAELEDCPALVACITGDFAMQNVLRQLGLQVLALDGRSIKTLRTYILRCYSCFKTTSKMELQFCPHCGHKTLRRASVVLRPDGSQEILISAHRLPTGRGKRFSLPKPQGGKHADNPLLCPDQRLPQQHVSKLARTKNNPLDPDYIAGFSPFVMRDVNSKSAMMGIRNAGEVKNWMRRNPNEVWKKGKNRKK